MKFDFDIQRFTDDSAMVRYNEISDSNILNQPYSAGNLYVTEGGKIYFDSPRAGVRLQLNASSVISSVINLNNLIVDGKYSVENVNCTNMPISAKGTLIISVGTTILTQVYITIGGKFFIRSGYYQSNTVTWNEWAGITVEDNNNFPVNYITTTTDLNNLVNGIYYWTDYSLIKNSPTSVTPTFLIHYDCGDYKLQTLWPGSITSSYRIFYNGTWTGWLGLVDLANSNSGVKPISNKDFNTSLTTAFAFIYNATSSDNSPIAEPGFLETYRGNTHYMQKYITISRREFVRIYDATNNTWSPWDEISSSERTINMISTFNIDDLKATGVYHCNDTSLILNFPLEAGNDHIRIEIEVQASDAFVTQKILIQNMLYSRVYDISSGEWSKWTSYKSMFNMNSNVITSTGIDFNTTSKIAITSVEGFGASSANQPVSEEGFLESFKGTKNWMQRYTTISGKVYVRFYKVSNSTWSSWKQLHS